MAANVSDLFKTLGARIAEAHNAAKDVPINVGGGNSIPGGINNGIARLSVMEFIEGKKDDDKGKYYFRAAMVVMTPEHHDGIKCAGKQDSKLIPFFDTPKRKNKRTFLPTMNADGTKSGHWLDFRDLMSGLGVTPPPEQQPGESKEAASARIQQYYVGAVQLFNDKTKPVFFEFRTWQPPKATEGEYKGKDSNVMVFWNARCDYTPQGVAANPASAVGAAPSMNGHVAQPAPATNPTFTQPPVAATPAPTSQPAPLADMGLDALAANADADPDQVTDEAREAVITLSALCKQLGITNEEVTALKPDTWCSVVALIKVRQSAQTPAQAASQAAGLATAMNPVPAKGTVVTYKGQAGCVVTSVNGDAATVTLKGADGKGIVGPDTKLLKIGFAELS